MRRIQIPNNTSETGQRLASTAKTIKKIVARNIEKSPEIASHRRAFAKYATIKIVIPKIPIKTGHAVARSFHDVKLRTKNRTLESVRNVPMPSDKRSRFSIRPENQMPPRPRKNGKIGQSRQIPVMMPILSSIKTMPDNIQRTAKTANSPRLRVTTCFSVVSMPAGIVDYEASRKRQLLAPVNTQFLT